MNSVRFSLSWRDYYEAEQFLLGQQNVASVPIIRQLRLKRRWQREPLLRAEHIVSYSSEGIHYLLDEIESNLDWQFYKYWAESPLGFLLIAAEDVFSFVPKRAFAKDEDQAEFRTLLTSHLRQQPTHH